MSLGFPTTYIINLERAEDKRAHAEQNISKYTDRYEFFNAVDGRALNVAQIGQYYDAALNQKLGKRPLSKPEIGCYLIPTVIDQNPCAHLRMPRDMIFHGWSMRLFQAWQHSATMSS